MYLSREKFCWVPSVFTFILLNCIYLHLLSVEITLKHMLKHPADVIPNQFSI